MSLKVSPELAAQAEAGKVDEQAFLDCVRESLPYAWDMVAGLMAELEESGADYVTNANRVVPETEEQWGQVFRFFASDPIRSAVEQHYGVRLAFQNCCNGGAFRPEAQDAYRAFVSREAQVLNQSPALLNC
jgi:hypothetical protein